MANTDDKTHAANQAPAPAQGQVQAGEKTNKPAKDKDEIKFFEGTITKLIDREVEDADGKKHTETVEVLSDNLYPGERLKREVDEEKAKKDREQLQKRHETEMDSRAK